MQTVRNRIFKCLCLLVMLSSASSCKKWLALEPENGIIRENFWKTKEQVQAAVLGCYASLLIGPSGSYGNVNYDRGLTENLFLWGELRADMLTPSTGITNEELDVMNVNILETNSITNWRSVYRTINYCNTVIDFAPGDETDIPRALFGSGYNWLGSDRYVEDASFLRFRTMTVRYTLPQPVVKKLKIKNLSGSYTFQHQV